MLRFILIAWLALCSVANAQLSGGVGGFPGPGTVHSAGAGFTGPGDVVSGALAWYSCSRGYNAADTANACNVCLPADVTCADITLSSGFAVVPAGLVTCNITTVICTVKTAYDKSGNGRNITNATEANRPTFRPAMASNGCPTTALPCMKIVGASSQTLNSSATLTQAQPITISGVYTKGTSASSELAAIGSAIFMLTTSFSGGEMQLFAGSASATVTSVNGSWHAFQAAFNSTSSSAYIDGTGTTSLNPGTGSPSAVTIRLSQAAVSNFFDGFLAEFGFWPAGFTCCAGGSQSQLMNANQHGANGYNF